MNKPSKSAANKGTEVTPQDIAKALDLITAMWRTAVLSAGVELKIFDALEGRAKDIRTLARETECLMSSLERFMRALIVLELVTLADGKYALTTLGRVMARGPEVSLWAWAEWYGRYTWPIWGNMAYSVRTGKSARELLSGLRGYEHVMHDEKGGYVFNVSMEQWSRVVVSSWLDVATFRGDETFCDVGGGLGEVLLGLLKAYPAAKGILVDLPATVERAAARLAGTEAAGRVQFVGGDFFAGVPAGANCYVLKSILHNWTDEPAERLLRNVRAAMKPGSRVFSLDRNLNDELTGEDADAVRADLNMLVSYGAGERTVADTEKLLAKTGIRMVNVTKLTTGVTVIEGHPM